MSSYKKATSTSSPGTSPGSSPHKKILAPDAAAWKAKKIAELRARYDELKDLSEANFAGYTCLLTAYFRAIEHKRNDGFIHDPYAEILAGAGGAALFEFMKGGANLEELVEYLGFRTRFVDEALNQRHPEITQVVIVGAGLDSRAFRMDSLATCHVFEMDSNRSAMERKQRIMDDVVQAKLWAQERIVVVADLTEEDWELQLIARGFNPEEPTFWLLEGILYYMNEADNARMIQRIDALSAPNSQIWADVCGRGLADWKPQLANESIWRARIIYGENDPTRGVLSLPQWDLEVMATLHEGDEFFGRKWTPMEWFHDETGELEVIPWHFLLATKHALPSRLSTHLAP